MGCRIHFCTQHPPSKGLSLSRRSAGCGENGMGFAGDEHDDMGTDQGWAMGDGLQPYTIDRYWRLCNVTLQGLSGISGSASRLPLAGAQNGSRSKSIAPYRAHWLGFFARTAFPLHLARYAGSVHRRRSLRHDCPVSLPDLFKHFFSHWRQESSWRVVDQQRRRTFWFRSSGSLTGQSRPWSTSAQPYRGLEFFKRWGQPEGASERSTRTHPPTSYGVLCTNPQYLPSRYYRVPPPHPYATVLYRRTYVAMYPRVPRYVLVESSLNVSYSRTDLFHWVHCN